MRTRTLLLSGLWAMIAAPALAQGPVPLSMQQAMDLAAKQSYQVQNSELEAEKARRQVTEVAASGLPQVGGSAGFQHYIEVPVQVVPNFFGGEPELLRAQFALPWAANAGVRLDQLLFDGSYLVGLRAARELKKQAGEELERSMKDARTQAAKAYCAVLAADEGARLAAETVPLLERSLHEGEVMLENGFLEATDVDRLRIELANVKDQLMVFQRQSELARNYLRFVLGMRLDTPIELSDDLDRLLDDPAEGGLAGARPDPATHIDGRIAGTRLRLQELNMRNEKAKFLPSLNGFFSYQQQWNAIQFEPFGGPIPWFPATMVGAGISVPIFSSGMRASRVAQARIGLEQAELNRTLVEERIRLDQAQRGSEVATALDLYRNERERLRLSKSVFDRTSLKFTEGMASSFELTTEQGNLLRAQQSYIQRVVDLVHARAELRRALDRF